MGAAMQLDFPDATSPCTDCHQILKRSDFYRAGKYRLSYCKTCAIKRTRRTYKNTRERVLERLKTKRIATTTILWTEYRSDAKRSGREFSLPRELFEDLISDNCFYCGAKPEPRNGIDRVDTAKGYFFGNVVTACRHCNRAKMARTREEFEEWIVRAARHVSRTARTT